MARNRMIKPEIWTSEQFVNCSPTARLLFIGMWNFADDHGIIPSGALHIKMCILPGDPFTIREITDLIYEIEDQKLIIRFESDKKEYLFITGWHHQKIDKPHYKYPEYNPDHSTTIRRPFDDHSTQEVKGKEREDKRKEREVMPEKNPAVESESFNPIIVEKKEEEKNVSPKKEDNAYIICMGHYDNFVKEQTGVGAKINGAEGNALKQIIIYLSKNIKNQPASPIDISGAFSVILDNFNQWEPFHQNQIKLTQINSNLINIIKSIKNGRGSNKKGISDNRLAEIIADAYKEQRG